jgi:hypothetical protein
VDPSDKRIAHFRCHPWCVAIFSFVATPGGGLFTVASCKWDFFGCVTLKSTLSNRRTLLMESKQAGGRYSHMMRIFSLNTVAWIINLSPSRFTLNMCCHIHVVWSVHTRICVHGQQSDSWKVDKVGVNSARSRDVGGGRTLPH